jgi:hypothetical protein
MTGLTSVHPQASVAALNTSSWPSSIFLVAKLWRDLFRDLLSSYRPELHYMRGPGPRWRERHGASARERPIGFFSLSPGAGS